MECWQDLPEDPREASSDKLGCATYDAWMSQCISQLATYVDNDHCINPEHLAYLLRLRLVSHWLSVVTGRWTDGGTAAWTHRYCRKCMAHTVEDERQFMMDPQHIRKFELTFRSCLTILKVL